MKLALLALCAVALYLRTGAIRLAFPPDGVNFLETDAWYHVRTIDHLVRNFPWRMQVDPYSTLHYQPELATGPFFDYLIATVAWVAGFGHPSERLVHVIAAWIPAILGMLIVPVVYLLGRDVFGRRAGLIAAAVVATTPGHFLSVSLVGYADHHVLESLLSTVVLWLFVRMSIAAGVALGLYLLTFVGGAFLVATIVVWMVYEQLRSRFEVARKPPPLRARLPFLVALVIVVPFYRLLWMNYSIVALAVGALLIAAIDFCGQRIKSQAIFFGGLTAAIGAAIGIAAWLAPGSFRILTRLVPSFAGTSQGVAELGPLLFKDGSFTLRLAWHDFGGAVFVAVAAVILLMRRPESRRDLILCWSLVTMVLAAGQIRMTYYLAVAVALLCGYLFDTLFNFAPPVRLASAVALLGFVLAPNVLLALDVKPGETADADWRETLAWMRQNTPEPFGDPNFYYAPYREGGREASYTVMAWWDYGYWITTMARRVPVSNPTQINAHAAAEALLAQSEAESAEWMEKWKSRYLLVDQRMPLLSDNVHTFGKFPNLFPFASDLSLDDFYIVVKQRDASGVIQERLLYRPAYFRTMLVRLFVFGGQAVEKTNPQIAFFRLTGNTRELTDLRDYPSEELAAKAEQKCRLDGCLIVSSTPMRSCVRLDSLTRFREIHSSPTRMMQNEQGLVRSSVQLYEFR